MEDDTEEEEAEAEPPFDAEPEGIVIDPDEPAVEAALLASTGVPPWDDPDTLPAAFETARSVEKAVPFGTVCDT